MELILEQREEMYDHYYREPNDVIDIQIKNPDATNNFTYFPALFKNEQQVLRVKKMLEENSIDPRRYFYVSLDTLSYSTENQTMKVSRDVQVVFGFTYFNAKHFLLLLREDLIKY